MGYQQIKLLKIETFVKVTASGFTKPHHDNALINIFTRGRGKIYS
jgi:hypothetical protein